MRPGTVLGHYRVLEPLGKGGMGEVYAAEDTRLHRTVAIKMLPHAMATDPDRRKRFEREAQAVAALNHPSIVTIHSVEEIAGTVFLTMEAVEGKTLKEMVPAGGLPIDVLLRVATAVSDALSAAHQRGITHRDLKPANVMVTPDGRVKVLDFGLAKLREVELEASGDEPTRMQSGDLTGEGRIIGTVAYMSPEQAEGKPVDHRSDIFSLGVMLHEMATGERPFKGDTDISLISSILKETPSSVTTIKPELPADLARIVRRCLAKDPGRRYQTATDLRTELEELKQDLDSGVAVRPAAAEARPRRRTRTLLATGGAAVLLLALGLFAWLKFGGKSSPPAATFTADRITRLTEGGTANLAALSRDGRYAVHVKMENGQPSVWLRQTATTSDVPIVPAANVRYDGLAFSPDGNHVYYVTYPVNRGQGNLYRIPLFGGAAIRLVEDIDSAPSFSPDGRSMAYVRGDVVRGVRHLMIAGADGSGPRSLSAPSGEMRFVNEQPAWSPDGRTILVPATQGRLKAGVMAVNASDGSSKWIGDVWRSLRSIQWMPDGQTFIADGVDRITTTSPQLWQVAYPSGKRQRITNDLNGYLGASLSADGTMLASVQSTTEANIWIADVGADPKPISAKGGRMFGMHGMAFTPDGRLLYTAVMSGLPQLWIMGADGANPRQLTSVEGFVGSPTASPDGRWIYYVVATDSIRIWRMGTDGSDQRPLTPADMEAQRPIVSPDGRLVYFTAVVNGQNRTMRMPADGGVPTPVDDAVFAATDVSADGKELTGIVWNDAAQRTECAILPAEGGEPTLLGTLATVDVSYVGSCGWGPSGTIAYADRRGGAVNVFARPRDGGLERQLTRFAPDGGAMLFNGAGTRDGRAAVSRGRTSSDVVLISSGK